jgi:YHS domain-containing protein
MTKDVVCGMTVDEKRAKYVSEFQGKRYYFCSSSCKASFDKQPARYVSGG